MTMVLTVLLFCFLMNPTCFDLENELNRLGVFSENEPI